MIEEDRVFKTRVLQSSTNVMLSIEDLFTGRKYAKKVGKLDQLPCEV